MLKRNLTITATFILTLFVGGVQADGDIKRGQTLAEDCTVCHGDDGLGDDEVPAIAGKDATYIRNQLTNFKTGARVDRYEDMVIIAADLSEQDIIDLASYLATLPGR